MEFSLDRFYQLNRKVIIWIILFGLIYLLRAFFTLIFLTFILSFFAFPVARWLSERLRMNQSLAVCLVYLAIFTGYIALYVMVLPNVVKQAASIRTKLPAIQDKLNHLRIRFTEMYPNAAWLFNFDTASSELEPADIHDWRGFLSSVLTNQQPAAARVRDLLPADLLQESALALTTNGLAPLLIITNASGAEIFGGTNSLPERVADAINQYVIENPDFVPEENRALWERQYPPGSETRALLQQAETGDYSPRTVHKLNRLILEQAFPNIKKERYQTERRMNRWISWAREKVQEHLPEFGLSVLKFFVNSLLAILFSFLIVLDYARLSKQVAGLASSRLRDFFVEAGQPVVNFAWSVGQGFQAIVAIAFITTLLMMAAMLALRLSSIAFLSVITFFTGLIPVIGTLFQAVPLVLVALNEGGPDRALWALGAFAVIHVLTGYVIAPIIFGRQFKMNTVAVIFILFVGHEIAGVWGMILGVPIANYILRDVLSVPAPDEAAPRRPQPKRPVHAH